MVDFDYILYLYPGCVIIRVCQNHIYTVYIRIFWQRNYQIYGHIRCIYTVLANPSYNSNNSYPGSGML